MLYTLTEEEFAKLKSDRLALEAKIKEAEIEIGTAWRTRINDARRVFGQELIRKIQGSWYFSGLSGGAGQEVYRVVRGAMDEFDKVLEGKPNDTTG
jgi:hypothetical protein